MSENHDILDKTYDKIVNSESKSNNKLEKLVTCLKSEKLVFDQSIEKENINENQVQNIIPRVPDNESNKIVEERIGSQNQVFFSKTPKNIINNKIDLEIDLDLEDKIFKELEIKSD